MGSSDEKVKTNKTTATANAKRVEYYFPARRRQTSLVQAITEHRTPVAGVLLQRPYSSEWESGFRASLAGTVLGNCNNLVKNIIHP